MSPLPSGGIVLEGIADVMEAITFVEFILEEGIQACALATFMAMRAKNYKAAARAMQVCRDPLLTDLKNVNSTSGWMAIYSHFAFEDFITATETSLDTFDALLLQAAK